jgi:hypothetical protein
MSAGSSAVSQDAPGDAGQLVGQGDRQHVVMQLLPGSLDPGLGRLLGTGYAASVFFPGLVRTGSTVALGTQRAMKPITPESRR